MAAATYSADIEWLLDSGAALGEHSTLAGQISTLEAGGAHGMPSDLPQSISGMPISSLRGDRGPGGRWRRLIAAWRAMEPSPRSWWELPVSTWSWWLEHGLCPERVLLARYCLTRIPDGLASLTGEVAGVVLLLAQDDGALHRVVGAAGNRQESVLRPIRARATEATKAAHASFYEALLRNRRAEAAAWLAD